MWGLEAFVSELGPQGPQLVEAGAGSHVSQQLRRSPCFRRNCLPNESQLILMNLRGQVYNCSQQGLSWGRVDPLGPYLPLVYWLFPTARPTSLCQSRPFLGHLSGRWVRQKTAPKLIPSPLSSSSQKPQAPEDSLKNASELPSESPLAHFTAEDTIAQRDVGSPGPRGGRGTRRTRVTQWGSYANPVLPSVGVPLPPGWLTVPFL